MNRYLIHTLGCKANLSDSQQIEHQLQQKGWAQATDSPDLCIINSCAVTDEAEKQTRRLANRLAKRYPKAQVLVTGCAAEIAPTHYAGLPGVRFVVGNQNKRELADLLTTAPTSSHILKQNSLSVPLHSQATPQETGQILGSVQDYQELRSRHAIDREWPLDQESFQQDTVLSRTRAFLKIQEGCNAFCTYCIIPYGRGPSRSADSGALVEQVRKLVERDVQEVVLTGTNIGDYPDLEKLVSSLLKKTSIARVRLSSLDPTELTPGLMRLIEEDSRLCPHFHVSLQSPSTQILKAMKRKYRFENVQECLEALSQLKPAQAPPGGVFVGMDVISGFPGETEEEFQWTYEALKNLPWTRLHVFPYSERSRTPATRLPDSVPVSTRVERARRLNALSLERQRGQALRVIEHCRRNGSSLDRILLEKSTYPLWDIGHTSNYWKVLVQKSEQEPRRENSWISAVPKDVIVDQKAQEVALLAESPGSSHQ